jgi:hypothetical protein
MKGARSTVWGVIAALMPALAAGQVTTLVEQATDTGAAVNTFDKPASPLSGAQLVAAKESSTAAVKLSQAFGKSSDGRQERASTWSLTATSPLNKNGDTDVASLDGLNNAGTVEFALNHHRVRVKKDEKKRAEVCARLHERTKEKPGVVVPARDCTDAEVQQLGFDIDRRDFQSMVLDETSLTNWRAGASLKYGYQNFDVVDPATAKKSKQDEEPWSVGLFYSHNPEKWQASFTATFQYQHAFKEGAAGVVCPAGSGSAVTCASGPVGEPKQVTKKLLSLEGRKQLGSIGVGLSTNYDFEAKVWGFELPLHFVPDEKDKQKLIAGVKFGYRDDTEEFTASVFVGTTFGLLK